MPYVASNYETSAAAPKRKGDPTLAKGTIIATFSTGGGYQGHAQRCSCPKAQQAS